MRFPAILVLAALAAMGCQSAPRTDAVAAKAPELIQQLTDQTTIYTCPTCHMEFDAAGKCSMCDVDLVQTRVDYICPADGKPVERAGDCPRCDAPVKIVKSAMAHEQAETPTGN